ncbi:MAG: hypothetical protein DHS20C21_08760 [Gemmatimonadota bacterium]|nr:MAG: hypothetical protein DHS20C21_08760 [Gemmatimonadota bacterium]
MVIAWLYVAAPTSAHPPTEQEIQRVSRSLDRGATAELLLERAELSRLAGDWAGALQDCRDAAALAPDLPTVLLCRARIEFDRGRPVQAEAQARAYLRFRDDAPGHRALARALRTQGRAVETALEFEAAAERSDSPIPDDYLDAARVLSRLDPSAALAVLDRGIARLGPLVALLATAADLATDSGPSEEALCRIDRILAEVNRSERWTAERGRVLLSLGRVPEAWAAFSESLAAIEELPPHHRSAPGIRALEEELLGLLSSPTVESQ